MSHSRATAITRSEVPAIGLSRDERTAVCKILNRVLANVSVLQMKTRKAHWDINGPQFHALHTVWAAQYERLDRELDAIAERVHMLGAFPVATMAGWLEQATLLHEEPARIATANDTVIALTLDHEKLARSLRDDADACETNLRDRCTADFLTRVLQEHEEMAWALRAFVELDEAPAANDPPRVRITRV